MYDPLMLRGPSDLQGYGSPSGRPANWGYYIFSVSIMVSVSSSNPIFTSWS